MKKIFSLVTLLVVALVLTGCWPAEVGVTTEFNADGSGVRTFVVDIMDDSLSTEPIVNPDDPDQDEGKGPVLNDKHVDGGVEAIQTWLEENAPSFITVHDATVDGYHRYFTFSFEFSSFEDYLDKYEQLVNLSPTISWDDFDDTEKPQLKVEGFFEKTLVYSESMDILKASLDWAVSGIWEDIYQEADLADFVFKEDIWTIANVKITIGDGEFKEERYYDPNAEEGNAAGDTGKVIFVESTEFEVSGKSMDILMLSLVIGGAVVVLAGIGVGVFFLLKKKPV